MRNRRRQVGRPLSGRPRSVRASVSLSKETYLTLSALAKQRKVSTAWILRDAAERYLSEQWPLFATNEHGRSGGSRGARENER
jgi:hypothetical protein